MSNYGIDWKNVDLKDGYTRDQNFLENYTFADLIMEAEHNLREEDRTPAKILAHAKEQIDNRRAEALDILSDNIENIAAYIESQREL